MKDYDPTGVLAPEYLMSQNVVYRVLVCQYGGSAKQNVVTKFLHNNDHGQSYLLYMSITGFRINEILTGIIYHVFLVVGIFLR